MDIESVKERLSDLISHRNKIKSAHGENLDEATRSKLDNLNKTIMYYGAIYKRMTNKPSENEQKKENSFKLPKISTTDMTDDQKNNVRISYPSNVFESGKKENENGTKKSKLQKRARTIVKDENGNKKHQKNEIEETSKKRKKNLFKDGIDLLKNIPAIGKVYLDDIVSPKPDQLPKMKGNMDKLDELKKKEKPKKKIDYFAEDEEIVNPETNEMIEKEMEKLENEIEEEDDDNDPFSNQVNNLRNIFKEAEKMEEDEDIGEVQTSSFKDDINQELDELDKEIKEEKLKKHVFDDNNPSLNSCQLGEWKIGEYEKDFSKMNFSLIELKLLIKKTKRGEKEKCIKIEKLNRGKRIKTYDSGKKVVVIGGIKKYYLPDNLKITKKRNKDMKVEYPDGRVDHYFTEFQQYQIKYPNQDRIVHFLRSRKSEKVFHTGESIVLFSNGVKSYKDNNRREQLLANGTKVVTHYKNGSSIVKEIILPDGRAFVKVFEN